MADDARRAGHGAALLAAALATLRAAGAATAALHVDAGPDGAAARRLYTRHGFAPAGGGAACQDYYGPGRHALALSAPL